MTIRHIDDRLKQRLRVHAARQGRSTKDEMRDMLRNDLSAGNAPSSSLSASRRARIETLGAAGLELPPRVAVRVGPTSLT